MPNYFAKFRDMGDFWIRHSTRIYLDEFNGSQPAGQCLGAIVGKNPGSAKAAVSGWGALRLDGDKMLPNVRNILLKAFDRAGKTPPVEAYFQVLNLFYLCGQDLAEATAALAAEKNAHADPAEASPFPLIWFAWGGPSRQLDPLKDRFLSRQFAGAFYYSPASGSVVTGIPSKSVLAKHPQGLPHEPVISYLAAHL
jgi:hypothetical protein